MKAPFALIGMAVQSANSAEAMVGAVAPSATVASGVTATEKLVSEQNLEAMAAHMVSDIPNAARLNRYAEDGTARILVDQQYFTLENGLAINKILFAHRLLAALIQAHSRELSFVESRQNAGSGRNGSSAVIRKRQWWQ